MVLLFNLCSCQIDTKTWRAEQYSKQNYSHLKELRVQRIENNILQNSSTVQSQLASINSKTFPPAYNFPDFAEIYLKTGIYQSEAFLDEEMPRIL